MDPPNGSFNELGNAPQSNDFAHSRQDRDGFSASRPRSSAGGNVSSEGQPYRPDTAMSQSQTLTRSRGGTLKKKSSLKRDASLKRSNSRRSIGAGGVKSLALGDKEKYEGSDIFSAFFTPVPTKGQPTELLANRFQDWRRALKDICNHFKEMQKVHEARSKSLHTLSNFANNIQTFKSFLDKGGINDATRILKEYHKRALGESNKAKQIEEEVITQLTGLRSDLAQKVKEIKSLSGDFKNSVDKEMENTRKAVKGYQEALSLVETDPHATLGKGDPFIIKIGVERQIDRQIDEENYLHKAFLNLESSGRELESIVVGEIQKAYNAYANILKREADEAYEAVENLRTGPIVMAEDHEWSSFVTASENFVDPALPIRRPGLIHFPGQDAPAAAEVRSGMLERKSKYLKSYTPGWYVLSTTHLHEFKSPDRLTAQAPIMSLYLQEQKLGSHSTPESSSHKFMLKGRQSGGMHRGHGWVFRAESHDTMLAWYEDVRNLTEKTGMEREAFVRRHARSMSGSSNRASSVSSDGGMDEDEADHVPYAANPPQNEAPTITVQEPTTRPQPGGRFQSSNLSLDRGLHRHSASSGSSDDHGAIAAAGALPGVSFQESRQQAIGEDFGNGVDDPTMHTAQDYQRSSETKAFIQAANSRVPMQSESGSGEPLYTFDTEANPITPGPLTASRVLPADQDPPVKATQLAAEDVLTARPVPSALSQPPSGHTGASPRDLNIMADVPRAEPHHVSGVATPLTVATTVTGLSDSTVQTDDAPTATLSRPPAVSQNSVATISDLQIPGKFPKATNS